MMPKHQIVKTLVKSAVYYILLFPQEISEFIFLAEISLFYFPRKKLIFRVNNLMYRGINRFLLQTVFHIH